MSSKRQMTMAKRAREQAVKERRALKRERKQAAAAAARVAKTADPVSPPTDGEPAPEAGSLPVESETIREELGSPDEKPGHDARADESRRAPAEHARDPEREQEETGAGNPA